MKRLAPIVLTIAAAWLFGGGSCECESHPDTKSDDIRIRAPGTSIDIDLPDKKKDHHDD